MKIEIKKKFYNGGSFTDFFKKLNKFNFTNKEIVRPSFDTYFMKLAWLAA
jgi:alkyl hydroperoxide reductase subunit AhpC